jgi:hypothetical protein
MPDDALDFSLGYYQGALDEVLAALQQAHLEGAILELDGSANELHDLVEECTAARPDLGEANHRARVGSFRLGPIKFGGGPCLLPIEGDNLARLRALLERHADPDIAFELRVRDADGYLVDAPDVGDNEIWVSNRLPDESVQAFRAVLGENLSAARG